METYVVTLGKREYRVRIDRNGVISVEGRHDRIDVCSTGGHAYSVLIKGASTPLILGGKGGQYQFLLRGMRIDGHVQTARDRMLLKYTTGIAQTGRRLEVRAPMPALVTRIEVNIGDDVATGQGLVILEAMKMENELRSHQQGKVKEILAKEGKPVEKGELLILLE